MATSSTFADLKFIKLFVGFFEELFELCVLPHESDGTGDNICHGVWVARADVHRFAKSVEKLDGNLLVIFRGVAHGAWSVCRACESEKLDITKVS